MDVDRETQAYQRFTGKPMPGKSNGSDDTPQVLLLRGSEKKPVAIRWLWKDWIAENKLHLIGGPVGTGKTTVALAVAAAVTVGGLLPDGTTARKGTVIIWSGEDDPEDTLIPRLMACGADLTRVLFVGPTIEHGKKVSFDPARDMELLEIAVTGHKDAALLIVDPILSAVAVDSHKGPEVRRALQPIVDLSSRCKLAAVGITHFSKGSSGREASERLLGSVQFAAFARVVMACVKRQPEDAEDGSGSRVFLRVKSNIGPDGGGIGYDLKQGEIAGHPGIWASSVVWGKAMEGNPRELLSQAEHAEEPDSRSALEEAKQFIENFLADGPRLSDDLMETAKKAGHKSATTRRAMKQAGVRAEKDGLGKWYKSLPPKVEDAQKAEDAHDNFNEHLQENEHLQDREGITSEGVERL